MLLYRKTLRDAVVSVLADETSGFNARLAASAVTYGIIPFTINFDAPPQGDIPHPDQNFFLGNIEAASVETSPLMSFPAACLYTTDALDRGDPRGMGFTGEVAANLDFYVRYRIGVEPFDTESILDAIEDAVISTLNDPPVQWPVGVLFMRNTRVTRDGIRELADGWQQRIMIRTVFGVYAN